MLRPGANEIRKLVRRLGSRSTQRVDAARARLSVLGPDAVGALLHALDDGDSRLRARAMPLLALIADPRTGAPMRAMLLDRNARLREIAARCLGRFPVAETVTALERALARERRESVRIAVVESLVELYGGGREDALHVLLERLADRDERPAIRLAALALVPLLKARERRSLLRRLQRDPMATVRHRAAELEQAGESPRPGPERVADQIERLGAADYASWHVAVQELAACGSPAVDPLLVAMRGNAQDPEFCARAGMALKAIGPRRCRPLTDALETVPEPVPLLVLVEVVGALGEKSMIYRLKEVAERIGTLSASGSADAVDPLQRVRARAHYELARVGSRVAIDDLREALATPRVDGALLDAVELIGKREELGLLLRAWCVETPRLQERIGEVVRSIMRRERIRRTNRIFREMGDVQRRALAQILPRARSR